MIELFKKQTPLVVFSILLVVWMFLVNPTYSESELKSYSGICVKIDYSGTGSGTKNAYLTMRDGSVFSLHRKVKEKAITSNFNQEVQNNEVISLKYVEDSYTVVALETKNNVYLTLREWNKTFIGYRAFAVGLAIFINLIYFLVEYAHYRMNRPKKKKSKKKAKRQIKS